MNENKFIALVTIVECDMISHIPAGTQCELLSINNDSGIVDLFIVKFGVVEKMSIYDMEDYFIEQSVYEQMKKQSLFNLDFDEATSIPKLSIEQIA